MPVTNYLPSSRLIQPGVCTSTTRPVTPFEGQTIYETDTDKTLVWNGSSWVYINPSGTRPNFLCYFGGSNGSAVDNATIAYTHELYDDLNNVVNGVFTVPTGENGIYSFVANGNVYNIGTSGYFRISIVTSGSVSIISQGSQVLAQGGTDVFSVAALTVKLAAGDTVLCRFRVPVTGLYSAGLLYNTFSGVRIA